MSVRNITGSKLGHLNAGGRLVMHGLAPERPPVHRPLSSRIDVRAVVAWNLANARARRAYYALTWSRSKHGAAS